MKMDGKRGKKYINKQADNKIGKKISNNELRILSSITNRMC